MKLTKKITPIALAVSMAIGGAVVPTIASAEMSANLGIASMYLWRGQNLTPDGPQVSGGIEYGHDSGAYGGLWTSNEDDGSETDLYMGYGTEVGGVSIDVSYWLYLYPEEGTNGEGASAPNTDLMESEASDFVVSLGYGPAALTVYNAIGSDVTYITLGAGFGDFSFTYGVWDTDNTGNDYSHITVGYAVTDELSLTMSVASNDVADTAAGAVETDPLFMVSYSMPIEIK